MSPSSGTPHSHPMFISSPPPISALCPNSGVANLFCDISHRVSAQSTPYPKTPRFLHIHAAFEPSDPIPVYLSLVQFFKATNEINKLYLIYLILHMRTSISVLVLGFGIYSYFSLICSNLL